MEVNPNMVDARQWIGGFVLLCRHFSLPSFSIKINAYCKVRKGISYTNHLTDIMDIGSSNLSSPPIIVDGHDHTHGHTEEYGG